MSLPGTTLCTSCGLCCSGALFPRTVLRPEEVTWAREKRLLSVIDDPVEPSFAQPCGLLRDRRCTAYEERPQVCRTFRCKLLKQFEDGEIGLDIALAKVRRVEVLFARLPHDATPTTVDALLDLGELEALAARDFRESTETNSSKAQS